MKIYFAGSIRGGRGDAHIYSQIMSKLKEYGEVLTEHVGNPTLPEDGEGLGDKFICERDLDWITHSDVLVAEITNPSFGVGYEVRDALAKGKEALCLYRIQDEKNPSALANGNKRFPVQKYETIEQAYQFIDEFFRQL